MELLKALNKSRLVTLSQKGSENTLQALEHGKNINCSQTLWKLEHAETDISRHVDELDALTTEQVMTI